jgi:hypothetical protein
MGGEYGCYDKGGLNGIREANPILIGGDKDACLIPFASDIKFNLIIRDMNP